MIDTKLENELWKSFVSEAEKDNPEKLKLFKLYAEFPGRVSHGTLTKAIDLLIEKHGHIFVAEMLESGNAIPNAIN